MIINTLVLIPDLNTLHVLINLVFRTTLWDRMGMSSFSSYRWNQSIA